MTSCRTQESQDPQDHPAPSGLSVHLAPWALLDHLDRSGRLDFKAWSASSPPSAQLILPGCSSRSSVPLDKFLVETERLSDFLRYQPYRRFPRPDPDRYWNGSLREVQLTFPWFWARPKTQPDVSDRGSQMTAALGSSKRSTSFYANSSPSGPAEKRSIGNAKSFEQDLTRTWPLSQPGTRPSEESCESGG